MADRLYSLSLIVSNSLAPTTFGATPTATTPTPIALASIPEMFFINKSDNRLWYANIGIDPDSNANALKKSYFNYIQLLTKTFSSTSTPLYGRLYNGYYYYVANRGNYPNGCSSSTYAFSVFKSVENESTNLDLGSTYTNYGINYFNKKNQTSAYKLFESLPANYFPRSVSYYDSSIYVLLTTNSVPVPATSSFSINIAKFNIDDTGLGSVFPNGLDATLGTILTYNLDGGNSNTITSTCDNTGNLYITTGTSTNNLQSGGVYKFTYPITSDSNPQKIITNETPSTNKFTTIYYSYYYDLLYVVNQTQSNNVIDLYYKDGTIYKKNYMTVQGGVMSSVFIDEDSLGNLYFTSGNGLMVTPTIICFKEDTKILTKTGYKLIQELKKGDLVKTLKNGYKPIYKVGHTEIDHQCSEERIKNQLYKCSSENYPELFEDLIITGCHCILVDKFKDEKEREKSKEINNINVDGDCMTETKFRLPACVDERTTVYETAGVHKIYHLALENDDYCMNYGIYANGLLVESTSKRFMDETLMVQND